MEQRYGYSVKPHKCWCGQAVKIDYKKDSDSEGNYLVECHNDIHHPGRYRTAEFQTLNGAVASWNQLVERDIAQFIKVNA
jgi:hypothetical protein